MSYYDGISNTSPIDRVVAALKRRPEALLLVAAGCAVMMSKSRLPNWDTRGIRRKAQGAGEYLGDLANQAYEQASSLAEPARGYANRVSGYVSETGSTAVAHAGDMAQQMRNSAQSNIEHYLHEQPIALGLVALAAGAAIGAALPTTDVENRTLGSQRDQLARKAQDLAEGKIQQLKEAAGEFGEKIASSVNSTSERSPS